jgi:hypothetical protein
VVLGHLGKICYAIENQEKLGALARERAAANYDIRPWIKAYTKVFEELLR